MEQLISLQGREKVKIPPKQAKAISLENYFKPSLNYKVLIWLLLLPEG